MECFPTNLNAESLNKLLSMLESLKICAGQPDLTYVAMVKDKKGKILSRDGSIAAQIDATPVEFD